MHATRHLSVFVLALATATMARAGESSIEAFDQFVGQFRKEHRVQSLSVAVAREGRIIFAEGYGYQDHDAEERTTPDTTYFAASITKTLTAATLLAMEADGHIRPVDEFTTLSDWVPRCRWLAGSGIIFGGGTLDDGSVIEPVPCDAPLSVAQVLGHRVNGAGTCRISRDNASSGMADGGPMPTPACC